MLPNIPSLKEAVIMIHSNTPYFITSFHLSITYFARKNIHEFPFQALILQLPQMVHLFIRNALRSAYCEQGTQTFTVSPLSLMYLRRGLTFLLHIEHLLLKKLKIDTSVTLLFYGNIYYSSK